MIRTIWIVSALGSKRGGLRAPRGPHILLRDEPAAGETIVAKLRARQTGDGWTLRLDQPLPGVTFGYGGVVRIWSTEATARGLGDDSDPHESRDVTIEWCREILLGIGDWEAASCRVEILDTPDSPDNPTPALSALIHDTDGGS